LSIQTKLKEESDESTKTTITIYFRDIKGKHTLRKQFYAEKDEVKEIKKLITKISNKAGGNHDINDLFLSPNIVYWIKSILDSNESETDRNIELIINDFSHSMMTRAREKGKFAVSLIIKNKFIICHSRSGQQSITTDLSVIERLLDLDNVDKYVEFSKDKESIHVNHFEKYESKSLIDWLGLPEKESIFELRGSINLFSTIDNLPIIFQLNIEEFIEKIVDSEKYHLEKNILKTPNNEFVIEKIMWKNQHFKNSDDLKAKILRIFHNLEYYKKEYEKINNNLYLTLNEKEIIDYEDKVKNETDDIILVRKRKPEACIFFVNKKIKVERSWLVKLAKSFISGDEDKNIFHAWLNIRENPLKIGNFLFYHNLPVEKETLSYINKIYMVIRSIVQTNILKLVLSLIIFGILEAKCDVKIPIKYLFRELKIEFHKKIEDVFLKQSIILTDEIEELLDYKGADWFVVSNDKELAMKIGKKLLRVPIIIGGIDENEQTIRPLQRGRFRSERLKNIVEIIKKEFPELKKTDIRSIPLNNNNCILCITSF